MMLSNYKLEDIGILVDGSIIGNSSSEINQIITDSRSPLCGPNSLFIAIKGLNRDGHDFIKSAYNNGIRNFLIEKDQTNLPPEANYIIVENTLSALQEWAKKHRDKFKIPVIAVTGSNGKTIVKEWLYHFLRAEFNIIRSPKSYNSQLGVPLSLLMINKEHDLAIIEAGVSEPGEMIKLKEIINPTHSLVTNIGTAHLENFISKKELEKEKLILIKDSKSFGPSKIFQKIDSFSEHNQVEFLNVIDFQNNSDGQQINYIWNGNNYHFIIPHLDITAAQNASSCVNLLLHFGFSPVKIAELSLSLPSIALRLQKRKGKKNSLIIDDTYNSDLASIEIALQFLENERGNKKTLVVLSDITQDLSNSTKTYEKIASWISEMKIDLFIGIGETISSYCSLFKNAEFFTTTADFLNSSAKLNIENKAILLKGSRSFKFEKIANIFEEKSHETILSINLKNLCENFNHYKKIISNSTKILCMIKAAGYGAGIVETAKKLSSLAVDYLGVAYTDEGVSLRDNGIQTPILVMNSEQNSFESIIKHNLTPSIYSLKQLDRFICTLIDLNINDFPIHLKFDTGMNRLGFKIEDLEELISVILSQPEVRVEGVFSHLASSDNSNDDDFSNSQFIAFEKITKKLEGAFGYSLIKHMLNTAGIERFKNKQYDMVRLGLGIYGLSKNKSTLPVLSLKTKISQIKKINKGDSIGYGTMHKVYKPTKIGIIPIGYADGFSRAYSNARGSVYVNGKTVPIIGSVCMDMAMIDITNVATKEGDLVEIFGDNRLITQMAEDINTIPYEILTSISERVVRVYLDE
ncbi:MAG: bifunctional UDP-N-acetylmuramoyl-tripeptide:D-alanyl-D-alanine ligase/alanine racemase [Flavobacteriales bacterium]|nr:bifunctional UDP-N-acetylmuramoyl-tripeptide:D-alanyl-D-alanine ligase/alanine racemase [Flavobacteriales bacterium]